MTQKRRRHTDQFKLKVALEAVKGLQTINEIASEYNLHPNQVSGWKKQLLEEGVTIFGSHAARQQREQATKEAELYEQIGRLKMELEWLEKKLPASSEVKRAMIDVQHPELSIRRQCELVGLNRATFYWEPASETPLNLALMRLIDAQFTRTPFYGYRRMTVYLQDQGQPVNSKRVARLMRKMGLLAVYPRPRTSLPDQQHKKYPYLLRGLALQRPNQVWSADITYVPLPRGFVYLVAVMDWYSRFVLAWQLSNTLDGAFCLDALHQALDYGRPEIFNTGQGAQFTAHAFTAALETAGMRISMDGRGRAFDNIFVERLWRTVKYEDIYIRDYASLPVLTSGLEAYFHFYNHERYHQSLDYAVPAAVHFNVKELELGTC
jgi:putative transposase